MVVITTMMRIILKIIASINNDVKGKENANRLNRLSISKTTTLLVDHISLPSLHDYDVKLNFTFSRGSEQKTTILYFNLSLRRSTKQRIRDAQECPKNAFLTK